MLSKTAKSSQNSKQSPKIPEFDKKSAKTVKNCLKWQKTKKLTLSTSQNIGNTRREMVCLDFHMTRNDLGRAVTAHVYHPVAIRVGGRMQVNPFWPWGALSG